MCNNYQQPSNKYYFAVMQCFPVTDLSVLCKENRHNFPYTADDKTEAEKGMKSCQAVAYLEKKPAVFLTGNENMNLPYPSTQGVHSNNFGQGFLAEELMPVSASFNIPTRLVRGSLFCYSLYPGQIILCMCFCLLSLLIAFYSCTAPDLQAVASPEKACFCVCTVSCVMRQC